MRSFSLLVFFLLVFARVNPVSAQSKKADKAYSTFEAGEYYAAVDQFKDAYQKTADKLFLLHEDALSADASAPK